MQTRQFIAVVMGTNMTCYREILRGINAYADSRGAWHLEYFSPIDNYVKLIRELKPAGLILGIVNSADEAREAVKHVPHCVGVCGQHSASGLPGLAEVESDDEKVGELAAQHFLNKGFTNFGYVGTYAHWSNLRFEGFSRGIRQAGHSVSQKTFRQGPTSIDRGWASVHRSEDFVDWIKTLPKPAALLACNDLRGREAAEICRDEGIRVPDDIAILGVDNDDLDCEISHPPLSSVAIPWRRCGHEGASLLDKMLRGEKVPPGIYPVEPIGVIERQSTDIVAINDPEVAAAIRFIREHSHEQISVNDVLDAVPAARRSLEKRFRAILGRSPLDEIRRVHIERAKQLLARTDLSMPDIAAASGFGSASWFSKAFHELVGETPMDYRKRFKRQ